MQHIMNAVSRGFQIRGYVRGRGRWLKDDHLVVCRSVQLGEDR
jgi:hypothetical protein